MKILKNIFKKLYLFVAWAIVAFIFWSWIFTFATDTSPERKITVYCHVPEISGTELAVKLEEDKPEGIKMIKVHSFEYVMFDVESIENGDIFILPESLIPEYDGLLLDPAGGIKIYDSEAGTGSADSYIGYADEDYYLFLGAKSAHLGDGAAEKVAENLIGLD